MTPSAPVKFEDLLAAYEWVSATPDEENGAFVSRVNGTVHLSSTMAELDDELPADIQDESIYVCVPSKHDLNLGNRLALAFAEKHLEDSFETVAGFFRRRGAYGRFKDLLDQKNRVPGSRAASSLSVAICARWSRCKNA